jgi:hypothetical protein
MIADLTPLSREIQPKSITHSGRFGGVSIDKKQRGKIRRRGRIDLPGDVD